MESKLKKVHIKLKGVNLNRIYKCFLNDNIQVFDMDRKDYKNLEFDVNFKDKNRVKEIAKKNNYEYAEQENYGNLKLKNFVKLRFGLLIGLVFFVVLNFLSSCFVWEIKIYGLNRVNSSQIVEILSQNSVSKGRVYNATNFDEIETQITNKIQDISLCSIYKRGTTIIVNVKEKLFNEEIESMSNGYDIIAPQNLTITSLVVSNGTALKNVGDSVKKGEVIVAGYVKNSSNQKIKCKANAKVSAKTWHTATINYPKKKEVSFKTGRISRSQILKLFDMDFFVKNEKNDFDFFEEEVEEIVISNNFLPFKMIVKKVYEVEKQIVEQDFEQDREKILSECQKLAYSYVKDFEIIAKIFDVVSEESNDFVVTSYVEVNFDLV